MRKCLAITRGGGVCKAIPITGEEYCYAHHPDMIQKRKHHGSKGGKRGGRGRPRVGVAHVKTQLQDLADGVLDGSVARADAAVASQILNVLLRALSLELQIRDQVEFEARLEALEEKLAERKAG